MMIANARRTRYQVVDPNVGLDLMRATEAAAIAAGHEVGRGERSASDQAAVDAMRAVLGAIRMRGTVVIGEGEKDNAPMLSNGEAVGTGGGNGYDIAVDPIDGTDLLATGQGHAISVIAASDRGTMFDPKGVHYMDKLVVGPEVAESGAAFDLDAPVSDTINKVAKGLGIKPSEVTVMMLDRPRHAQLIADVREAGARIAFIPDGDIAGAIAAAKSDSGVDLLLGSGGTPEGIITACAMKAMGGMILSRLAPQTDGERAAAEAAGHDLTRVMTTDDLVAGDNTFFVATGITPGWLLDGIRYARDGIHTQSIVMRSRSGTIRHVDSVYRADRVAENGSPLLVP